ncbi:MAG: hypothetical protein ABIO24_01825 [Saprospiraceae bacterium]
MEVTKQGEKLLLLARRDSRTTQEIALAMGIDKSYLPKLYKMEILPAKPLQRALAAFKVPASYFLENQTPASEVAEPGSGYANSSLEKAALLQLKAENARLREELKALKISLEQERATHANLAEALKNLSKRD